MYIHTYILFDFFDFWIKAITLRENILRENSIQMYKDV